MGETSHSSSDEPSATAANARHVARARLVAIVAAAVLVFAAAIALLAGPVTLAVPRSCRLCHTPALAYDQWALSSHRKVTCARCHEDRAAVAGLGNSFALVAYVGLRGDASPGAVNVSDAACLGCHNGIGSEAASVVAGLRMSHAGLSEGGYQCTECHAQVAHKVPAARDVGVTMSTCARCHNNVTVSGACALCHPTTETVVGARLRDPVWSRTHGANWRQLHGMGDLSTCTICHSTTYCQKCHGVPLPHSTGFIATHGAQALKSLPECTSCHLQSFCDSCHGIPMPHPSGFLPAHSKVAKGLNDVRCIKCHTPDNCAECHARHIHPAAFPKPGPVR